MEFKLFEATDRPEEPRAEQARSRGHGVPCGHRFDPEPRTLMSQVPADDMIAPFERCGSIPDVTPGLAGAAGVPA